MVEGRSKQVFKTWLSETRPLRNGIDVIALDGFAGLMAANNVELPDAAAVMEPFHVVRPIGRTLDQCRRRVD